MALNRTKVAVLKNGKLLMANSHEARTFKSRETARKFVANLCWVSKSLTPLDFRYIPVSE